MRRTRRGSPQGFVLKKEIDLGQILTSFSIVLTLAGLGIAWNHDRLQREKEYADRIRRSASVVTAKIERWAELSGRYFEDLQPTLVAVSETLADGPPSLAEQFARQCQKVEPVAPLVDIDQPRRIANRTLYRGLMEAKAKSSQRVVDEQLQLAYMELYGFTDAFQPIFDETIEAIKGAERTTQDNLSDKLQSFIRDPCVRQYRTSPQLGNVFRDHVAREELILSSRIRSLEAPLRQKMLQVIQLSDRDLYGDRLAPSILRILGPAGGASAPSKG